MPPAAPPESFTDLPALAGHLRSLLKTKRFVLLYAFNATGKTRLSGAFRDLGKQEPADDAEVDGTRDTLYFNAFTEDLFLWDNDLDHDQERVLRLNTNSRFFDGLGEMEMETRVRRLLGRYASFDFRIDTTSWEVSFSRQVPGEREGDSSQKVEGIKVSRGEENLFIWCFFLAVAELAMDGVEAYHWVRYVYIDDPISSLDEGNAAAVAHHLASFLLENEGPIRAVVSTHHVLFFNALANELKKKAARGFLKQAPQGGGFLLEPVGMVPLFQHLAALAELERVRGSDTLQTHHFNMLRNVFEQTAGFFGLEGWASCIQPAPDDDEKTLYERVLNIMSHGDYTVLAPQGMMPENKQIFSRIFEDFKKSFPFDDAVFSSGSPPERINPR